MCFFLGIKSKPKSAPKLGNQEIDISDYSFLFKEVQVGFDFDDTLVVTNQGGDLKPSLMQWGFAPNYIRTTDELEEMRKGYKDETGKFHPGRDCLNARVENIFQNIYKSAAEKRHCVIPITHFFEWRHIPKINKKTGAPSKTTDKFPYAIEVKDQEFFWLAGIWQNFTDKETGEVKETFAIITQPANELMKKIHNSKERMPAILDNQQALDFIITANNEATTMEILNKNFPSDKLNAYTIKKSFKESVYPLEPITYNEVIQFDNPTVNGTLF